MSQDYDFFFFNDTATTEIYTLSLHDALPISIWSMPMRCSAIHDRATPRTAATAMPARRRRASPARRSTGAGSMLGRSEEHTSELQSRQYLVCRLLLEKKKPKRHCQRLDHVLD